MHHLKAYRGARGSELFGRKPLPGLERGLILSSKEGCGGVYKMKERKKKLNGGRSRRNENLSCNLILELVLEILIFL